MTGQALAKEFRIRAWAEMITERAQSGKTVETWCSEHGISKYVYYYRLRKVRKQAAQGMMPKAGGQQKQDAYETPVFAALPMPQSNGAAATVCIGPYVAEINNGADLETVDGVLRTLSRL